ncbi:Mediator of RNA polymerase II transcription subunit 17 [Lamellibrachia satsuma]|nr:Mediator of RNA polymerase II transcription subunit 17 [Lamellibrachia satsuma]
MAVPSVSSDVAVSIEAIDECQIQEITLDGQEIYIHPLSMSENLTKLAHKIDFTQDQCDGKNYTSSEGDKPNEDESAVTPFQPSLWPWDSVRTKLRMALTEMSVLQDVLNIAKQKHYMVLDTVSADAPETRSGLHLCAKKKALLMASGVLLSGAERLRRSQEASSKKIVPDFHQELLRVRQAWRLKKVGDTILGDLSYKSAGSRFWQSGTFEVTKSDIDPAELLDSPNPSAPPHTQNPLQIIVPSELEGVVYIQVVIKRLSDSTDLASAELSLPRRSVPSDTHWQHKLEAAQNAIFCKEVFAQLSREAIQMKAKIPHLVIGNQIFSHLFPGVQLSVALCHSTDKDKRQSQSAASPSKHDPVLEHSLHQLLRETHFKNSYHPMPHPVTGIVGMSKRRCLAGPHAFTYSDLVELSRSESLLDRILKQARHTVVHQWAIKVVDELARTIQDPQISAHWGNISSPLESSIKVNITSAGYESQRTPFVLHILTDGMRAVCKDGRVIDLSWEPQHLRDLILSQIAQHHIISVQTLSKMMGWPVLSVNTHLGIGDVEPVCNALAIMLASPNGTRVLSIRSGPVSRVRVGLQRYSRRSTPATTNLDGEVTSPSEIITNPKWQNLGSAFMRVDMDKIEGRNFVNKIEILMASLTTDG